MLKVYLQPRFTLGLCDGVDGTWWNRESFGILFRLHSCQHQQLCKACLAYLRLRFFDWRWRQWLLQFRYRIMDSAIDCT